MDIVWLEIDCSPCVPHNVQFSEDWFPNSSAWRNETVLRNESVTTATHAPVVCILLTNLQEHELCSATTTMPLLESTHRELSFEWSHLQISLDSSGFRSFLGLVKFAFCQWILFSSLFFISFQDFRSWRRDSWIEVWVYFQVFLHHHGWPQRDSPIW